ncbi:signal peptide peptidase-domain-containing protein [Kockovaella imperatae]|uniref:Signal peptide peptidase-domain-containing protein n=1 Tax=Kockovaella imperatae TaxID=4999 RepID=A0A1Y1UCN8_9TREE|nr:signal peptide peptidase-domain-containing protein [Kockovaella imperatae]ORX35297.1 signal peptide peptidase-domain-containing protein [Kockovaella imperatae]
MDYGMLSAYFQLGFQALFPLVVGSFKSLQTPASTKAKRRAARHAAPELSENDDEDDNDSDEDLSETLSWTDSLAVPILGSVALLSLWLLIKYVGKEWVSFCLGVYFSVFSVFALHSTSSTLVNFILRKLGSKPSVYHIRISTNLKQLAHTAVTLPTVLLIPLAIALPSLYLPLGRPFWISNILALSLATTTLSLLKLDSFLTAFSLLALLLVYDVFWVFATPVMVDVARGVDAPIKLLAPKSGSSLDFAMLGLGDIIVPGLVIALCLRFDMYRHTVSHPTHQITRHDAFGRAYWYVAMTSYILGMAGTMSIVHWSGKAQPALLYLSPACILGPLLFALARGEFKLFWGFSDAPGDESQKSKLDETIEAPSEAAMRAKQGILEDQAEKTDQMAENVSHPVQQEEEDDSWMDGTGVATGGGEEKSRKTKKKGAKKK